MEKRSNFSTSVHKWLRRFRPYHNAGQIYRVTSSKALPASRFPRAKGWTCCGERFTTKGVAVRTRPAAWPPGQSAAAPAPAGPGSRSPQGLKAPAVHLIGSDAHLEDHLQPLPRPETQSIFFGKHKIHHSVTGSQQPPLLREQHWPQSPSSRKQSTYPASLPSPAARPVTGLVRICVFEVSSCIRSVSFPQGKGPKSRNAPEGGTIPASGGFRTAYCTLSGIRPRRPPCPWPGT